MESSEVLRDSALWARDQVKQVGVMGGLLTSVKKMTGAVPRIPTPSQVLQGSGQSEHDLVRQMAEMRVNRRSLQNHADPVRPVSACAPMISNESMPALHVESTFGIQTPLWVVLKMMQT